MSNCTAFLDVNARLGDKPALIFPTNNEVVSFRGLLEETCRIAGSLQQRGIVPGDRVCLYLAPGPRYVLWYFAIWRIGAVAVPLNNVLRADEVVSMLDDSGSVVLVTDTPGYAETAQGLESSSFPVHVILDDSNEWKGECRRQPPFLRPVHCSCDQLCQLQYTSGTTGKQKGAMLTHGNWMAALDAEVDLLAMREEDVYLGIYPMAHVGVSWSISALKAGATWVILERFDLERYISLTEKYRVTVIAGMPPVIHSLIKTPEGTEKRMCSAREMISGGGPLLPSVWKEFHRRFAIPVINAYGLSETIVVGTGTAIRPEDYATATEFQSVGMPVGYSEVKIVDTNDPSREMPVGGTGEIALRGPGVACGYWDMPEESAEVFLQDGWFLTGDIGHLHENGMLSITDRKKDMIVMSGWKIYPTEVEKALIDHPGVDDIAIFGVPDDHRGEIPFAAVVKKAGASITLEDLQAYSRNRLAGYKVPRKMVVVSELPRLGGWKLLRRELRERYLDGTLIQES
ncbi:MAG TPA: acyl-CoA synthetase [Methanoculleus sp.]|mgnify:CR=1 FL=1|nr:acyl-CoA synthetase [Methanoculleus sp.]